MVTSAAWVDYDHDDKLDLIVVGEWMPIRILHQENGHFVDRTTDARLGGTDGWWNTIQVADLNADGRPDLILGNLGFNSTLRASADEPARLYVGDFFARASKRGGAWMIGSPRMDDAQNDQLARTCAVATVSLDYRMAPEHRLEDAIDDCEAAALWLLRPLHCTE